MTVKGAFKHFPKEQQPERIPLEKFPVVAEKIYQLLSPHGKVYIPDARKKGGIDTGDVDVLFVPNKPEWREVVKKVMPNIVAEVYNKQYMMVSRIIDEHPYMIDIIPCKDDSWEFTQFYYRFGSLLPAILGSLARTLGYKIQQDGLYVKVYQKFVTGNNCEINYKLTNNVDQAMAILGLKYRDDLYHSDIVVPWILSSPRFDSKLWLEIGKNHKSHKASQKKEDTQKAYNLLDSVNVSASILNENFAIERSVLGDKIIDDMLKSLEPKLKERTRFLDGFEIMAILDIESGKKVGKLVNFLETHPELVGKDKNLNSTKFLAVDILFRDGENYAYIQNLLKLYLDDENDEIRYRMIDQWRGLSQSQRNRMDVLAEVLKKI